MQPQRNSFDTRQYHVIGTLIPDVILSKKLAFSNRCIR
jgi:hypothetical protein